MNWIQSRTSYGVIIVNYKVVLSQFFYCPQTWGVCVYLFIMHITLTMSTGDVNFKGYIQTCWVMFVMSKIYKCSTMNPTVSKEDSIFNWFSYWSWTQNKTGRWHLSKMFFHIYNIVCIYIYIYLTSFLKIFWSPIEIMKSRN